MTSIMDLREQIDTDHFDYQQLLALLTDYSKPRDKISALLASGDIIRIRKGFYLFGERYCRQPVCRETLANLIYGPSYISFDYALSAHGLIPERINEVTSVTMATSRKFDTPLGFFSYRPLSPRRYSPGVRLYGENKASYLMACPEKALLDKIWSDKKFHASNSQVVEEYLFLDLRLDAMMVAAFDDQLLSEIAQAYDSKKITRVVQQIKHQKGGKNE